MIDFLFFILYIILWGYMQKIIYISGKITGTEDYEERFLKAEMNLRSRGFNVLNPVKAGKWLERNLAPKFPTWVEYMKQDLKSMMIADCIYMLKGYRESKGARLELFLAKFLQYEIIYEE